MTSTHGRLRRTPDSVDGGDVSLPAAVARWARTQGDKRAVAFVDHRVDPEGEVTELTWGELDARVDAVAAWCQKRAARGARAAVLVEQGTDYVVAFLGVLRAGLVAVPLFEPNPLPGHTDRLAAVLADCAPELVLTTSAHADAVESFLRERELAGPELGSVDVVATSGTGAGAEPVDLRAEDVAYLQYTSGSTRTPAGVVITHGNVVANAAQGYEAYECEQGETTSVCWLPLFHDMGLVVGLATPVLGGFTALLMDPIAFVLRPQRWLEEIAGVEGPVVSAAPNFAYGYVASRMTAEERAGLRLDHVVSLGDGSEPVMSKTLDTFYATFADNGLDRRVHRHTYGLAEAVVMVSVSPAGRAPREVTLDRVSLAAGRAVHAEQGTTLVSAGQGAGGQFVRIADPATGVALPEGHVGEIWSSGPNVGQGYWGKDDSHEVFEATLTDADGTVVDPGWGRAGWLRTGDLGVLLDGDLFIAGRIKDLIIVDGTNHYPQDIEYTAEQAHPAIRRHTVGAFSVPGETGELAVVVAERAKQFTADDLDHAEVAAAVKSAVSGAHALAIHDVVILGPGEVPRTSSGKIQRSACRARYAEGTLRAGS
ncbi:Long-chain-fatty-acid--CoA ligase [Actinokineospora spheciospongiae]|uniref:Long-chain-fatty-acid--CoA ligase n=1 Tax=Actinokineospora spheciospongiae TaxID=909613 RepID=W7J306_9PSEU|nr:fatty acyl-AMP ligase [Actinokineospora spheciospongiae]EWC60519.1 Long-chain-fatty-acid--CoA ligase [Actinokineospora spheciospongiae]